MAPAAHDGRDFGKGISMKKAFLLAAVSASLLSACGGADNVAACNKWKESVKCGSSSAMLDSAINCNAYANTACDISEYFSCLSTAYFCKPDGTYDSAKLANASSCASKAVCK
jgi:hypothetical protein